MRVTVTGGAGFIGVNLVRALQDRSHGVTVLDDFSTGHATAVPPGVEILVGDVRDEAFAQSAIEQSDAVVHLAARGSVPRSIQDPTGAFDVNARGTMSVLEAARVSGAHLIFASSSSVYGRNQKNPKHEKMWVSPMSPYAASKLAAESLVGAFGECYGMDVLAFRFFNVFGPWQRPDHVYAAVAPKWLWRAIHDVPLPLEGDGLQSRDFTSVHTVTDVLTEAVEKRTSHPTPVNLAYGNNISLLELKYAMEQVIGRELPVSPRPPRTADVQASQNDPALLKSLFPDIRPRSFESTLQETYEWLLSQRGHIPPPE